MNNVTNYKYIDKKFENLPFDSKDEYGDVWTAVKAQ